jgi:acetyl esterase/lipase
MVVSAGRSVKAIKTTPLMTIDEAIQAMRKGATAAPTYRPPATPVFKVDPLRDEGLAYYRRLLAAGVDATGRAVLGACHGADLMFRAAIPDMYAATIQDLRRFATTR